MNCFVIGNGESRKQLDLHVLRSSLPFEDKILGCNALYRDFEPDWLFVHDLRMVEEVKGKVKNVAQIIDNQVVLSGGQQFSLPYVYKLTGIMATVAAPFLFSNTTDIYLIGFDMYPSEKTGMLNNVYKDTTNYRKHDDDPTLAIRHSMSSLKLVFENNPHINYHIVNDKVPSIFYECDNVYTIGYSLFKTQLSELGNG